MLETAMDSEANQVFLHLPFLFLFPSPSPFLSLSSLSLSLLCWCWQIPQSPSFVQLQHFRPLHRGWHVQKASTHTVFCWLLLKRDRMSLQGECIKWMGKKKKKRRRKRKKRKMMNSQQLLRCSPVLSQQLPQMESR